GDALAEREQNLALGVEPARPSRLDAIDGERGEARLPGELRLAHHERLAIALDVVARHAASPCRTGPRSPMVPCAVRPSGLSVRADADLRQQGRVSLDTAPVGADRPQTACMPIR